ncbi:MAG: hypothetical protein ABI359_10955 [Ginsengibacter sp.]
MVGSKIKIVWSEDARLQLKAAYNYIKKDSSQNANMVRTDIADII